MYRFFVILAVCALVSGRAPVPSIEIEDDLDSNLIDFSSEEDAFRQLTNSSAGNDESNGVTNLFTFAQLTAVPSKGNVDDVLRYTLGKRVKNDSMVGHSENNGQWPSPQDITIVLKYPTAGKGAKITCVEIVVRQSSNIGQAKVTAGGIGQRSIVLIVRAGHTRWIKYAAYFYGI